MLDMMLNLSVVLSMALNSVDFLYLVTAVNYVANLHAGPAGHISYKVYCIVKLATGHFVSGTWKWLANDGVEFLNINSCTFGTKAEIQPPLERFPNSARTTFNFSHYLVEVSSGNIVFHSGVFRW